MSIDKIAIESELEREALDMINTTSKQVESLANNSEFPNSSWWSNGDECIYMTHNVVHQFIGPCPKREGYGYIQAPGFEVNFVELSKLSKPESQEQKAERERLEIVKKACLTVRHDYGLMTESDRNFLEKCGMEWLKAFEKLGCIKE